MKNLINEQSKQIWDYIYSAIPNTFAVAAMMGNLYSVSELDPRSVNGGEAHGYSAEKYTNGVDSGTISMLKFVKDGVPYGLGHWKHWTRKQSLYNMARKAGKSIGDTELQCAFILDELSGITYGPFLKKMKVTKGIENVTHFIFEKYMEHEGLTHIDLLNEYNLAKAFYDTYGVDSDTDSHISPDKKKKKEEEKRQVRVTKNAHIRKDPNGKSESLFYVTEGVTLDILGMNDKKNYYHVCIISVTNSIPSIESRVTGWISKNCCKLI